MKSDAISTEKKLRNDSSDTQTNKRIHEHLTNENDVISDEDINNAKTDITTINDSQASPESEPDETTSRDVPES
ncbi:hypothetical protein LK994_08485 [Ferruginibacter lapsinanis]|uniref:hypothetical protein n=1 Tax=Ferruginibacter lapsinanis TaxID=563172 RepID=UPI001E59244D|nr:hypothetical protein [Ferruginibacter lapsinanis]UEG48672.1 hypothetical protein LK994_08485 [Ferruginibacter lapsinanis]